VNITFLHMDVNYLSPVMLLYYSILSAVPSTADIMVHASFFN